jgi:coproporphyrinogen III oxidase-like Fe-S oxidoreductase
LYAIQNRCGFNRVSLGVQSMDDEILKVMGRQHTVQDVYDSMIMLREANITSISIDLICGQVPGLTLSKWITTLQKAANLYPNHMSVYDLQLERGTIFDKWYKRTSKKYDGIMNSNYTIDRYNATKIFPTVEDSAFMYKYTSGYLRSRGYEHYEISSYAAPGRKNYNHTNRSQHNSLYWEPNSQWIGRIFGIF